MWGKRTVDIYYFRVLKKSISYRSYTRSRYSFNLTQINILGKLKVKKGRHSPDVRSHIGLRMYNFYKRVCGERTNRNDWGL